MRRRFTGSTQIPRDTRDYVEPHIWVALSSEDYRNNVDPVLETILNTGEQLLSSVTLQGYWSGQLAISKHDRSRLGVNFSRSEDGWAATLDLPQDGVTGISIGVCCRDGSRREFFTHGWRGADYVRGHV